MDYIRARKKPVFTIICHFAQAFFGLQQIADARGAHC
jgi:hypothetical protein